MSAVPVYCSVSFTRVAIFSMKVAFFNDLSWGEASVPFDTIRTLFTKYLLQFIWWKHPFFGSTAPADDYIQYSAIVLEKTRCASFV